jgi:hypothetical protein
LKNIDGYIVEAKFSAKSAEFPDNFPAPIKWFKYDSIYYPFIGNHYQLYVFISLLCYPKLINLSKITLLTIKITLLTIKITQLDYK